MRLQPHIAGQTAFVPAPAHEKARKVVPGFFAAEFCRVTPCGLTRRLLNNHYLAAGGQDGGAYTASASVWHDQAPTALLVQVIFLPATTAGPPLMVQAMFPEPSAAPAPLKVQLLVAVAESPAAATAAAESNSLGVDAKGDQVLGHSGQAPGG